MLFEFQNNAFSIFLEFFLDLSDIGLLDRDLSDTDLNMLDTVEDFLKTS